MFSGLRRGLQLIGAFFAFMAAAVKSASWTALQDAMKVAALWITETFGQAEAVEAALKKAGGDIDAMLGAVADVELSTSSVKLSWTALIGSADPWKASRLGFEALKAKYPSYVKG